MAVNLADRAKKAVPVIAGAKPVAPIKTSYGIFTDPLCGGASRTNGRKVSLQFVRGLTDEEQETLRSIPAYSTASLDYGWFIAGAIKNSDGAYEVDKNGLPKYDYEKAVLICPLNAGQPFIGFNGDQVISYNSEFGGCFVNYVPPREDQSVNYGGRFTLTAMPNKAQGSREAQEAVDSDGPVHGSEPSETHDLPGTHTHEELPY